MGRKRKAQAAPEQQWTALLIDGHHALQRAQRFFRHLPSAPRCKMCHNPFGGVGGKLVGVFGFKPSRKNPNLCMACCEELPPGGIEVDTAVLFADVRGSTTLAEQMTPSEFARLLQRFYVAATAVLVRHDAIIDKLIGDEVMAFFVSGIAGEQYRRRAVEAGAALVKEVRDWLPLGAGVHAGPAFVGNVGEAVVDFTVLGDTVNTAARLQASAAAGELVVSAEVYPDSADLLPTAQPRTVRLRGKSEPMQVFAGRP